MPLFQSFIYFATSFMLAGMQLVHKLTRSTDHGMSNCFPSVRIGYVEFYTPESVLMALAMANQQIRGQTIMINAS